MIVEFDQLHAIRQRHLGQPIVLATGVFDLLHPGHVEYLSGLHNYGEVTVVIVKSDIRVRTFKGSDRPINNETDRLKMVDGLKGVDYVALENFVAGEARDGLYHRIFEALKPDVYVTHNPDRSELTGLGSAKLISQIRTSAHSTTAIIKRIRG